MTSILVETATAIALALTNHSFDYGVVTADWDYEHRTKDADLVAETLDVRVIVPRTFAEATRFSRDKMRYCAAFDVDIRFKFATTSQGADAPQVGKDKLADLSTLVEDIHQFFFDSAGDVPLDPWMETGNMQWLAAHSELGVESKILVAYSSKHLREMRMFYAVCREFFFKVR